VRRDARPVDALRHGPVAGHRAAVAAAKSKTARTFVASGRRRLPAA
jgi:hypothetical protein